MEENILKFSNPYKDMYMIDWKDGFTLSRSSWSYIGSQYQYQSAHDL